MATIQRYGLKKRHMNKLWKEVDQYCKDYIDGINYKSELSCKYRNRFNKYRGKLFKFMKYDNVLWHNNHAEHALRHITLQAMISKKFYRSMIDEYLVLLSIKQTCKCQNKSFLKFLLSGEKDIDKFKN